MKTTLKIPNEFIRKTDEEKTIINYLKGNQAFAVMIPLPDVIDWSNPEFTEISFDTMQDYQVEVTNQIPNVPPLQGEVKGSIILQDLGKLVHKK